VVDHAALQDTSLEGPASPDAARLTASILAEETTVDTTVALVAEHLLSDPRVAIVTVVLTILAPDDPAGWTQFGGRAWVREWMRSNSTRSLLPGPDAGPEAALTMPWVSRIARTRIVAITDRDLLPDEAAQDHEELTRSGVRSMVTSTFTSQGAMFGSLSLVSLDSGPWPEQLLRDFRLLNAAIVSRLTLEHSRRALAEAIETGAEAQLAYQQFYGSVGHELRTPLAAILGYTEVILDEAQHASPGQSESPDGPMTAAVLRDGPAILRAGEQLLGIVDALLGAGRTMSDDDQRRDVVVADAVADVVHWHRTPAQTAGVDMAVVIDPATTVWAHASGVRQVLTSLVGNAIAHHRPGGGTVHISTTPLLGESGREMVRIIVRDDGPGMSEEQLAHVFEPFVRFAAPRTKGSGLGLSISRTIAERDGGAVRGESTPGVGSSFWVELPAHEPRGA
jgi:signal transduction histidine kinase